MDFVLVNHLGGVATIYGQHLTHEIEAHSQCTTRQLETTFSAPVRLKRWALQKLKAWVCPKHYISRESKTWGCDLCLGYLLINSPTNPNACGFSSGVCWVMNTDILSHEYQYLQHWIQLWGAHDVLGQYTPLLQCTAMHTISLTHSQFIPLPKLLPELISAILKIRDPDYTHQLANV